LTKAVGLDAYVSEQLVRVGLDPATRERFPHQFSGGQRQRIHIARALALNPRFLVCDESIASLDVSIQAQILNLFMDLRDELNLTYLFISHDLRAVQHFCDRVAIMYLGRIVEEMPTAAFSDRANHPYTQALLAEIPDLKNRRKTFTAIKGEIPSPINPPSGCHFHPRCPFAFDRCRVERPALKTIGGAHRSACHLNDEPSRRNGGDTRIPA
jgi:peptide/nickel transport system ATP-binding protein